MSSAPTSVPAADEKLAPGRIAAAIAFALFAIAFLVVTVIYVMTPARDLPGFMGHASSAGHDNVRAAGSFLACLLFTGAAWFALRYRSLALEEAREADILALEATQAAGQAARLRDGADALENTQPMGTANTQPMEATPS